jgi:hypothetical protein
MLAKTAGVRGGAMIRHGSVRALAAALALPLLIGLAGAQPAAARAGASAFMETLDEVQRRHFEAYLAAQTTHEFKLDAFWREVNDKRVLRRRKKTAGEAITADDYVMAYPPEYRGPLLGPELSKSWSAFQARHAGDKEPPKEIPGVEDFLAAAKTHYGFEPMRVPEREFKARYAREALSLGLTKDQVVRIYALETGGQGTADMQAGIHPITRQGKPISTALGYAQLLHANSVNEIAKHGPAFVERLKRMAVAPGLDPRRATHLKAKAVALARMVANVRRIPYNWERHMDYAKTGPGLGIHALNLDGDIGPWLQVIKLKGLKEEAEKAGRTRLTPAEMELMNLAGPGTGLEMMMPVAHHVPNVNFFSRQGYGRNSIVRGRTAMELLQALDKRMDEGVQKPGAVEFAAVFDEAIRSRRAER